MTASEMKQGDMFLFVPQGMLRDFMVANVYVKMHDGTQIVQGFNASTFIKNSALVKKVIDPNYVPMPSDTWSLTDKYFNDKVEEKCFFPIEDLREVDAICEEQGVAVPVNF